MMVTMSCLQIQYQSSDLISSRYCHLAEVEAEAVEEMVRIRYPWSCPAEAGMTVGLLRCMLYGTRKGSIRLALSFCCR